MVKRLFTLRAVDRFDAGKPKANYVPTTFLRTYFYLMLKTILMFNLFLSSRLEKQRHRVVGGRDFRCHAAFGVFVDFVPLDYIRSCPSMVKVDILPTIEKNTV